MTKKTGRNDPCPCGSNKKFKRCHGQSVDRAHQPRPRKSGVQTIYCDESGFTGNNLLDEAQPTFAYSAVAIEAEEAEYLIARAHRVLGIPTTQELKSNTLLGSLRGREVLVDIVKSVGDRSFNFVAEKKFALACKFFEYVFEPIIAENNAFFYRRNFHKFIANLLYLSIVVHDAPAERVMASFQRFMRSRDPAEIAGMLGVGFNNDADPVRKMLDIAAAYQDRVADELRLLAGNDQSGKWVLDLSTSAVFLMLGAASERFERLDVYCDDSKPIKSNTEVFDLMVGRKDRSYMTFEDRRSAVTFDLVRPISFVSSHAHAGIRIADFVAGAINYSLKGDGDAQAFAKNLGDVMTVNPISPDPDFVNLDKPGPFLNGILLEALHTRALAGDNPLDGLAEEHQAVEAYYKTHGRRLPPA